MPGPLNLKQVHGRFIFADDQSIQIEDLNGWLEEVPFKISGKIMGYFRPPPKPQIRIGVIRSARHRNSPARPDTSIHCRLAVREIYDRFKPRGICRFCVVLDGPEVGARPRVTGRIDVVDGNFTFDKFPYPVRKATGQIVLDYDPDSGEESLRLDHIRGRGVEGGPNPNSNRRDQRPVGSRRLALRHR